MFNMGKPKFSFRVVISGINQWENKWHQLFKIDQLRNICRLHTYNSAEISLVILRFEVTIWRILRCFHFNKLPHYIEIILALYPRPTTEKKSACSCDKQHFFPPCITSGWKIRIELFLIFLISILCVIKFI